MGCKGILAVFEKIFVIFGYLRKMVFVYGRGNASGDLARVLREFLRGMFLTGFSGGIKTGEVFDHIFTVR
jgi:hypothetical protein